MASRKRLKKTIQFVSSELITDVYFRCLMTNKVNEKHVDQLVKAYFRKLYSDWQKAMEKIIAETEKL